MGLSSGSGVSDPREGRSLHDEVIDAEALQHVEETPKLPELLN